MRTTLVKTDTGKIEQNRQQNNDIKQTQVNGARIVDRDQKSERRRGEGNGPRVKLY